MSLPTFSALNRAAACPASCALPQVETTNEHADLGHARHRYLELVPQIGADAALAAIPEEHRSACGEIVLDGLPLDGVEYAQEVALCYDVETGEARKLGTGLGRRYPEVRGTEMVGTLDVMGLRETKIVDYKGSHDRHTPPAARNLQVRAAALAASRIHATDSARVELIHLRDDGSHWTDAADLDALDLAEVAVELGQVYVRVRAAERAIQIGQPVNVAEGPHCHYCPAMASCPAKLSMIRAMAATPQEIEREIMTMLTPETAAAAYRRAKVAREVLNRVEGAIYAWAKENPIDLGDGQVLGPVTTTRDSIKGEVAFRLLTEIHGPEVAQAAVSLDASKASIERALKGRVPKVAPAMRELLAALGEAGGIESKTSESVKEHKA